MDILELATVVVLAVVFALAGVEAVIALWLLWIDDDDD